MRWAHIIRDHCCEPLDIPFYDEPQSVAAPSNHVSTAVDVDYDDSDEDAFADVGVLYFPSTLLQL